MAQSALLREEIRKLIISGEIEIVADLSEAAADYLKAVGMPGPSADAENLLLIGILTAQPGAHAEPGRRKRRAGRAR